MHSQAASLLGQVLADARASPSNALTHQGAPLFSADVGATVVLRRGLLQSTTPTGEGCNPGPSLSVCLTAPIRSV